MLHSYHERTQHLFHHLQPTVTGTEKRHLFEGENPRVNRFWDRKTEKVVEERKGVHHLVQCWAQQAHKVSLFLVFLLCFDHSFRKWAQEGSTLPPPTLALPLKITILPAALWLKCLLSTSKSSSLKNTRNSARLLRLDSGLKGTLDPG